MKDIFFVRLFIVAMILSSIYLMYVGNKNNAVQSSVIIHDTVLVHDTVKLPDVLIIRDTVDPLYEEYLASGYKEPAPIKCTPNIPKWKMFCAAANDLWCQSDKVKKYSTQWRILSNRALELSDSIFKYSPWGVEVENFDPCK